MAWLFLLLAIASEITATSCLKLTNGFSNPAYLLGSLIGYPVSYLCFGLSLKQIEVSTGYALWSGIGVVGTAILGTILFHEKLSVEKLICFALITCGVVGLNWAKQ